jgi:hypothetical protein
MYIITTAELLISRLYQYYKAIYSIWISSLGDKNDIDSIVDMFRGSLCFQEAHVISRNNIILLDYVLYPVVEGLCKPL